MCFPSAGYPACRRRFFLRPNPKWGITEESPKEILKIMQCCMCWLIDFAVLHVNPRELTYVPLAESFSLHLAEWLFSFRLRNGISHLAECANVRAFDGMVQFSGCERVRSFRPVEALFLLTCFVCFPATETPVRPFWPTGMIRHNGGFQHLKKTILMRTLV